MTTANYLQRGEALDFTNDTAEVIPAGVILTVGDRIGVTGTDTAPGAIGSLHVVGVFEIAKADPAEVIEMGKTVYFDGTGITASAGSGTTDEGTADEGTADEGEAAAEENAEASASIVAGYAAAPSTAEQATVLVKLCG